jgi:hypothetical protein
MRINQERDSWEKDPRLFPLDKVGKNSSSGDRDYTWLLRSMNERAVAARNLLELWFHDFPADIQGRWELYRRFSGESRRHTMGAFWELFCFNLLREAGFVVESHPTVDDGNSTHPDFCARYENGSPASYLEARFNQGTFSEENDETRCHQFIEELREKVRHPNRRVSIGFRYKSTSQPSARRIAQKINERINEAGDVDFEAEDNGWWFDINIYPKADFHRDGDDAIVSTSQGDSGTVWAEVRSIRMALSKKKAGKYGVFKVPYIIALNSDDSYREYVDYALFGDFRDGIRVKDGFFHNNSSISGVFSVEWLTAANALEKKPCLFVNPDARNPIPSDWFPDFEKIQLS